MLEVIKGARPGAKYLTDHCLSLVIFGAAAAEFLLWPKFGTSVFCLLTLLALVDFVSGLALRARRGVQVVAPVSRRSVRTVDPAFEPRNEMEAPRQARNNANDLAPPARSAPESPPVVDPVLKAAPPDAGPGRASPQVQSPDRHPNDDSAAAATQPPQH
jgi:hypothetical protein